MRAKVRLVVLDIKGAFDSVWWQGLLCHLLHIGIDGLAYRPYLFECFLYVATAEGWSSMLVVSVGVPQGAIWSPLFFNLYIFRCPVFFYHCMDTLIITLLKSKGGSA